MDVPQQVIRQLAALAHALDEPGRDLPSILDVLVDDLARAVPSFLGLTLTVTRDRDAVTLHVLPPELADAVTTSLLVPLNMIGVSGTGGTVVFYAARPGALVDLAADTRFAYGLDGQVVLDQHLPDPVTPSGVSGPAGLDTIHQGIGILIDCGHLPDEAHSILQQLAVRDEVTLSDAAQRLVDAHGHDGTG
jgi:hypothetical protein